MNLSRFRDSAPRPARRHRAAPNGATMRCSRWAGGCSASRRRARTRHTSARSSATLRPSPSSASGRGSHRRLHLARAQWIAAEERDVGSGRSEDPARWDPRHTRSSRPNCRGASNALWRPHRLPRRLGFAAARSVDSESPMAVVAIVEKERLVNGEEARALLAQHLEGYRAAPYPDSVALIDSGPDTTEIRAASAVDGTSSRRSPSGTAVPAATYGSSDRSMTAGGAHSFR